MLAYLFPGQGSQKCGMGKELFDLFPEYTHTADSVLGYSIKELCTEDPNELLNHTEYTQPALFVVSALSYLKELSLSKQKPDFVAGHSLGEYNALFAAGVFDFTTGLKLVKKRGELMSQARNGSMAAVIGLKKDQLQEMLKELNLHGLTIANYNTYQQFVISGPKEQIEQAGTVFSKSTGIHFIPLNVSGAFHSHYMNNAQNSFAEFIEDSTFKTPYIPVIANINAKPYHPAIMKDNLINQIAHPVRWTESMEYLFQFQDLECKEIGPGSVLTGMLKKIKDNYPHHLERPSEGSPANGTY